MAIKLRQNEATSPNILSGIKMETDKYFCLDSLLDGFFRAVSLRLYYDGISIEEVLNWASADT